MPGQDHLRGTSYQVPLSGRPDGSGLSTTRDRRLCTLYCTKWRLNDGQHKLSLTELGIGRSKESKGSTGIGVLG